MHIPNSLLKPRRTAFSISCILHLFFFVTAIGHWSKDIFSVMNRFKKLLWNCCSMSNIINPFLYSMYEYGPPIISFNSWRSVLMTMLIWLVATIFFQVVGNCARPLVNDRQRSRGGKIQRGFRSYPVHAISVHIHALFSLVVLVYPFINVFLASASSPYLSYLPFSFLRFSSSLFSSPLPFPSLFPVFPNHPQCCPYF